MRHIITIMQKQLKDTLKNKTVLIQFAMFPALGLIMVNMIRLEGMPENFFVTLFASMYVGMAPLTCVSAIISEEKEKNTLRVLMMADVTPWQYLLGIGGYVFLACMLGGAVFCGLLENVTVGQRALFLLVMAAGIIVSIVMGASIGVGSRSQMAATSVSVPVMMVFSFLPMLSMFNDRIEKIARFTYTEQIRVLTGDLGGGNPVRSAAVILMNIVVFGAVFSILYKKSSLC
ncbi:MAG: ABC transporter permease [Eubacterium sp.]|nr:ABC transporter permease [Eubacterium sp.]MCM1213065.1 ABC transporter permease [Lachnospiraceae bacterium]MCM1304697.1 ABC transporter permease [Butyrivibrio sp.]MCM1344989.1 ABC transporter permease [Muribaculaceae bacterium]MCM1240762.1 ABC transporter permease [Lachnospiraceae bacterium]